ncbi:MAG: hypothetical protein OIF35_07055 [Cellvibrionaceae bacterium]|nr:hypothetical protein [Cellvibrionaceae bacterium]MCV6625385.1 hypothetical protein [Cellvibrionaceae bacterium]
MKLPALPKLSAFLLGALVAVLVLGWANQNKLQQQRQHLNQSYGQMLARNIAQQAESPALTRDLVSLQVLAENAKRERGIASVTFHSVDNKLLAQAGKTARQRGGNKDQSEFTAPINLHDSVAGYVSVGVDSDAFVEQENQGALGLLALILLAGALINIYWQHRSKQGNAPLLQLGPSEPAAPEPQLVAWLVVQSGNLASLQKQLSATALEELLGEVNQQLQAILSLYSGKLLWVDGHSFHCGFHSDEEVSHEQAIFNAICSTKLLVELGRSRDGIKLHFKAAILPPAKGESYSDLFAAYRGSQIQRSQLDALPHASVLADKTLLAETQLTEQLELSEDQHNFYIDAIKPPYVDLLNDQLRHLQAQK